MVPVRDAALVRSAAADAKTAGAAFCTNFFVAPQRLDAWIARGELYAQATANVTLFFRTDRDFWHLYFTAAGPEPLRDALTGSATLASERVVTDLVGHEAMLSPLSDAVRAARFRAYATLERMSCGNPAVAGADHWSVELARVEDAEAVLALFSATFDRYAEQLPVLAEIEAAAVARQVLIVRDGAAVAGVLFFETHGYTSTLRYWVVAPAFQGRRIGAALMRRYFAANRAAKRFVLWAMRDNAHAIARYRHYGYAPDGLVDRVFANENVRP